MRWVLLVSLCIGCVKTSSIQCADGRTCPERLVCDEVHQLCVQPDQLVTCVGMPDEAACAIEGETVPGECRDEVCIEQFCGDRLATHLEACDGANTLPEVGTCIDFNYDYGNLGCTDICSEETTSCHRLGWQFRAAPGGGAAGGIAEDGDQIWIATQTGIVHFDGNAWHDADEVGQTLFAKSIWASGGHAFAVGSRGPSDGVLLHFDGTSWDEMIVTSSMNGVWGRSPNDVWAVGDGGKVFHYTTSWQDVSPATGARLAAVHGTASKIYAVGATTSPALLVYDGASWSSETSFALAGQALGVWAKDDSNVYLVGDDMTDGRLWHYDGTAPPLASPFSTAVPPLRAITGRGDEMFVVGEGGTILFNDGKYWELMPTPTTLPLNSVYAGAKKIYAANTPSYFMEYEGAAWVTDPGAPSTPIRSLWTPSTVGLLAIGDGCVIMRRTTLTGWGTIAAPTAGLCGNCGTGYNFMHEIWGSAADDYYVVGPYGIMWHYTGGAMTCGPQPLGGKWLFTVWGTARDDVWIGGSAGDGSVAGLAHYNGTTWQDLSDQITPYFKSVNGVWGPSQTDVFFVGDAGTIVRFNGSTFTKMTTPPGVTAHLHAVWGTSANDVFAVGDKGTLLHFDGTAWTRQVVPIGLTVPTDVSLADVQGSGPNDVYAVGGRTLLHYDGTHWSPVARPDAAKGLGVSVIGGQVFVVGDQGIGDHLIGKLLP